MRRLGLLLLAATGCGDDAPAAPDAVVPVPVDAEVHDAAPPSLQLEPVTSEHRAIPGVMFGGWGPHLGHLVQAPRAGGGTATYWVDDLCSPQIAGDCNVDINRRVGVFRRDAETWTLLATIPLAGVQQNTATIALGDRLWSFGVDTTAQRVVECRFEIATGASGCTVIPIPTGPSANYVGATVGPAGARLVWWTNVVDGGGGSFSYIVDYGGGWNGPRTGAIGGYNDCAYAHAAFQPGGSTVEFFCQVVAGLAPSWTFSTLVGSTDATLAAPVTWTNALAPPTGDEVASTNDLFVEPGSGDAHVLARSSAGAALYYHRPAGGSFGTPLVLPATYRARWLVTLDSVAVVHDAGAGQVVLRTAPRSTLDDPGPWSLGTWSSQTITLPAEFGAIYAIYPLGVPYQEAEIDRLAWVVVGEGNERHALYVGLE